jgi:CHASE3 domain sensor protein
MIGLVPPAKSKSLARLYWSLVVSTAFAVLLVVATIWFAALRQTEDEWVRHTLSVRNQIARVLTLVQRAESGQRGYLLTGREMYLAPYEQAIQALPAALDDMGGLVADNPLQQQSVGRMRQLTIDKLRELRSTIDARHAGNPEGALAIVNNDSGQRTMDEVRSLVATMEQEENRLLTQRQVRAATLGVLLEAGAGAALLVILAAAALGSLLTRRSFRELAAAHDELVTANEKLMQQQSRREAAESQLRQSQKMEAIGQLSGGIAHDFNNMLGVISGSLDLMRRHIAKGDFGITRYLDAAFEATKRSAVLTHRLLAFARQQPLAPEPLDANRMIATMSDLLRSTLGEQVRIETVNGGACGRPRSMHISLRTRFSTWRSTRATP